MNDGMHSSGLVCISTNTFSDVDILYIVNKNIYIGERVC